MIAGLFQKATEAVIRDACSYRCDLCHLAMGTGPVDQYWACEDCARAYLFRLEMERWP